MSTLKEAASSEYLVGFYGATIKYQTLVSVKILIFGNGQHLSSATGFFFDYGSRYFLVSNWHVFAGRNSETGQPLDAHARIPDAMTIRLHTRKINENLAQVEYNEVSIPLYNGDQALWRQHPSGQSVDLAAIAVEGIPKHALIAPLNVHKQTEDNDLRVGNDVFAIGFPENTPVLDDLPIWKRGTLASEVLSRNGVITSLFYVDCATRRGMSGSPVYRQRDSGLTVKEGRLIENKPDLIPIGVYSGRWELETDKFGAELGRVWPLGLIEEITNQKYPGAFELRRNGK